MAGNHISIAAKRIQKELLNISQSGELDENGISVETVDGNLLNLKGVIIGPADTPYENGKFLFYVEVPEEYPFYPVEVRFITKIWHPNISSETGEICLNILQDEWASVMGLKAALIAVKCLLSAPEPNNALDDVVGRQFKRHQDLFQQTAKFWAKVFAGAPGSNPEFEEKVREIASAGVDEKAAVIILSASMWKLEKAFNIVRRVRRMTK